MSSALANNAVYTEMFITFYRATLR